MQIREVMTSDVETIGANIPLKDAAAKMKELDVGLMPVCDGEKLRGLLTDRDITVRATAEGRDPKKTKVSEIMSADVVFCFEDQDVEDAVSLMEVKQIRRVPILNREKHLVGIISLGDIAVRAGDQKLTGETLREVSEPAAPKR
jgi:CBS domain-containing protein